MTPEMLTLLKMATEWRPSSHTYQHIKRARRKYGYAANVACLPLPPSTNMLYPGKARRYKSKAYKAWELLAETWWGASPLYYQPAWPLDPEVMTLWTLDTYLFMPRWAGAGSGDMDNRLKAPIDFLCSHTGLQDKYLVEIHAKRITTEQKLSGLVLAVGLA